MDLVYPEVISETVLPGPINPNPRDDNLSPEEQEVELEIVPNEQVKRNG